MQYCASRGDDQTQADRTTISVPRRGQCVKMGRVANILVIDHLARRAKLCRGQIDELRIGRRTIEELRVEHLTTPAKSLLSHDAHPVYVCLGASVRVCDVLGAASALSLRSDEGSIMIWHIGQMAFLSPTAPLVGEP
jgi:hypothetical protein